MSCWLSVALVVAVRAAVGQGPDGVRRVVLRAVDLPVVVDRALVMEVLDEVVLPRREAEIADEAVLPRREVEIVDQAVLPRRGAEIAAEVVLPRRGAVIVDAVALPRRAVEIVDEVVLPRRGAEIVAGMQAVVATIEEKDTETRAAVPGRAGAAEKAEVIDAVAAADSPRADTAQVVRAAGAHLVRAVGRPLVDRLRSVVARDSADVPHSADVAVPDLVRVVRDSVVDRRSREAEEAA